MYEIYYFLRIEIFPSPPVSTPDQTTSTMEVTMANTIAETIIQDITSDAVLGTTQITPTKKDGGADNNGTSLKQGC